MYIKIKGLYPRYINQYAEIAFFLDCEIIQQIIQNYRERINLTRLIPYKKYAVKKTRVLENDELSDADRNFLADLNYDIDTLENKELNILTSEQKLELDQKISERDQWIDPIYTFTRAIKIDLEKLNRTEYLSILMKAILCGEIRRNDVLALSISRIGTRKVIYDERDAYWLYKKDNFGYGSVGRKLDINSKTATSRINSYKCQLAEYQIQLIPSFYRSI